MGDTMPSGGEIVVYPTWSTTQASVIIPTLTSGNRYYLFSLDHGGSAVGRLCYSVIDMSLDGGLGDVDPLLHGISMRDGLTEKMICIPGNDCNFWLVVRDRDSAHFLAYEVSAAGINMTPVVSSVGTYSIGYSIGVIKVSPNRKKIACMGYLSSATSDTASLFDFDPNTGVVSNRQIINTYPFAYGAEFSPDNSKLYTYHFHSIYQYDITGTTTSDIVASEYLVHTYVNYGGGDMKLGPDAKIYFRNADTANYLDRINFPNLPGTACGFTDSVIDLSPNNCQLGFPNLYWSVFLPITGPDAVCVGGHVTLSSESTGGVWSSADTLKATIGSVTGVVTGISSGTVVISYTKACGTTTKVITVGCASGVVDINAGIGVYPNPVTDKLVVETSLTNDVCAVSILDMLGRIVIRTSALPTNGKLILDTSELPTGSYSIKIDQTERVYRSKFTKSSR